MIAGLIEWLTGYEYDYKFYMMHKTNKRFPIYEEIFIYTVFYLDVFILFSLFISVLVFGSLGIAWLCGGL